MSRSRQQAPVTRGPNDGGHPPSIREVSPIRTLVLVSGLTLLIWVTNAVWLSLDTRPPVWDMALHQTYAYHYVPGDSIGSQIPFWQRSGVYPPFVHLVIAVLYMLFRPDSSLAPWANLPATFILLWSVASLGRQLSGRAASCWACVLTAAVPFLFWMSRETILDYWLCAWVAAALAALSKSDGFVKRRYSILFGVFCGAGLLTKWLFAAFVLPALIYAFSQTDFWREPRRKFNALIAVLLGISIAAPWYIPNLTRLVAFMAQNARVGELEGEPAVWSFQSFIYYLRLLEGYQLFAPLLLLLVASLPFAWKRREEGDLSLLGTTIVGAWLILTMIRTKDPRFTMPLLGPLCILPAMWLASLRRTRLAGAFKVFLILFLVVQAYMINFGISFLPEEVRLYKGYQGSLQWNWNFYLQHYFHILGKPQQEDWQHEAVLGRIGQDASEHGLREAVGVVPDLPRLNVLNLRLSARQLNRPCDAVRLYWTPAGIGPLEEVDYILTVEGDQGMSWTTTHGLEMNRYVAQSRSFSKVDSFALPGGRMATLYRVERGRPAGRS